MVAKTVQELEGIARGYVNEHFPALRQSPAAHTERRAKTPGAPSQYVFDFAAAVPGSNQRVRLVLDGEGKVVKVTASR
ncbi:MAG: hypothetical protein ACYC5O_15040 [Anaerolineae bacterium]